MANATAEGGGHMVVNCTSTRCYIKVCTLYPIIDNSLIVHDIFLVNHNVTYIAAALIRDDSSLHVVTYKDGSLRYLTQNPHEQLYPSTIPVDNHMEDAP